MINSKTQARETIPWIYGWDSRQSVACNFNFQARISSDAHLSTVIRSWSTRSSKDMGKVKEMDYE